MEQRQSSTGEQRSDLPAAGRPGGVTLALPKGRILDEALPLLKKAGIAPEPDFHDPATRKLRFASNIDGLSLIRVRAFDVATFVAFGAADLGIAGSDVIAEFDYREIYAPLDLGIGRCRLSLAEPQEMAEGDDPAGWSHVRIATKYPNLTRRHFAARGVQAECIRLSGAMELAPTLGLTPRIVDLVSTGATLKANGLKEVEVLMDVSARLIVNRAAFKTRSAALLPWIDRLRAVIAAGKGVVGEPD
ncbi:MAG: ATP phosphoribosyltransferase [Alphaproteobacteria bacterium]|nr:MAG: ATP phosphoribosyltransferase [Alphaproteobacteria bacterium]